MKKIYSLTLASLLACCGFAAVHAAPVGSKDMTAQEEQVKQIKKETGEEMVGTIRRAFEAGEYRSFLAELDASYQQVAKEDSFAEFIQMREMPPTDEQLDKAAVRFETFHQELISERNSQLQEACQGHGDALICARVQSAITQLPSDQKDALKYISGLRFKTPKSAASDEEKLLIEIDLASEYKIVHLDAQYAAKPFEDRVQKHMVIKMDMLKQMQEASSNFSDQHLKNQIELALQGFDAWQAHNWDMHQLNVEAKQSSGELEKKIASILTSYKNKKDDLYQKEVLETVDPR